MSFPRFTGYAFVAIVATLFALGGVIEGLDFLLSLPYAKILDIPSMLVASPGAFFVLSAALLAVALGLNYQQSELTWVFNMDSNSYSWEHFGQDLRELKMYAVLAAFSTLIPVLTVWVLVEYCSYEIQMGMVGGTVFVVSLASFGWTGWIAFEVIRTLVSKARSIPNNQRMVKQRNARAAQMSTR